MILGVPPAAGVLDTLGDDVAGGVAVGVAPAAAPAGLPATLPPTADFPSGGTVAPGAPLAGWASDETPALPAGWERRVDAASGRPYYVDFVNQARARRP